MRFDDVWEMVGNTPSVRMTTASLDVGRTVGLYVKLEGCNPTGSIKDRAGAALLRDAIDRGELTGDKIILDASSGNMATTLAYFGRLLGFRTVVVAGSKLTSDKRAFIEYFGADLRQVGEFTIQGNEYCRELMETSTKDQYCFLDQLHAWVNPAAHEATTGPELLRDFPDLGMVVGSLGSGGTMCGVSSYLRRARPDVVMVAVESKSGTRIPGTGSFVDGDYVTPFIARALDEGYFDERVGVSEAEAIAGTMTLRDAGIFTGLQTGGLYHAAIEVLRRREVAGDVVLISGDTGWKNLGKLAYPAISAPATVGVGVNP